MPSPAPEPLSPRPLTIWLVNPLDDIPGEGVRASRTLSLARVLSARGHEVAWWSSTWSHRRKAVRRVPPDLFEDEGFTVRLVAVRAYERDASLARLASRRDFGRTLERLVTETVASGQLQRPDLIVATLPPLAGAEACVRLARTLDTTLVVDLPERWPETRVGLLPGPAPLRRLLAPWLLGGLRRRRDAVVAAADGVSTTARHDADPTASSAARAAGAVTGAEETPAVDTATRRTAPRHVCPLGAYLQEFAAVRPHVEPVPLPGAVVVGGEPMPPLRCVHVATETDRSADMLVKTARLIASRGIDVEIHVVVDGAAPSTLRHVADRARGGCRLVVHESLDRRGYVDRLVASDVALVGMARECTAAMPVTACECAAAGLAIVHGLSGDPATLVDRHGAGLAAGPDDPSSWADVLGGLATDRRRLAALRDGARRLAATDLDRETVTTRWAAWLEAVAAGVPDDSA